MTNETKSSNEKSELEVDKDFYNTYGFSLEEGLAFDKEIERLTKEETKLQDLIITKSDLQQLKVLDKPTDTKSRLVWIIRTIAYEYSRGKNGCNIPLQELGITKEKLPVSFMSDICLNLDEAGYNVNLKFNKELIGDCLEIVWD